MPKRTDIQKILLIGSGPIIIGQACEFDYSGTQACKVLRQEGFEIVLVNSNPATIMTDPEMAHRTYVEPLTPEILEKVIERERPDALLPTLGGQTGLNLAVALAESGILDKYQVELIGATLETIKKAEDRDLFRHAMTRSGLEVPASGYATSIEEAEAIIETIEACPSGALSYTIDDEEHRDCDSLPAIKLAKNGPYEITGGVSLVGIEFGDSASREHFTLCRCGASKNKPFCDGSHFDAGFEHDEG